MAEGIRYIISAVDDFTKTFDNFESEVKRMEKAAQGFKVAGAAMVATGVAIGSGLGVSIKSASDFESAFAGVRKTVDASEAEFAALSAGIRQMAKEMPQSAVEIASVAEAAGQLGIQTDAILEFTKTMVNMGVATDLASTDAAMSLARFATITQMAQSDFDKLGATIVGLGNNLAATESEIVDMGLRIAGAGNIVGMTESEILGFAASLSAVGINAEAGGSAFSKLMIDMANQVATSGDKVEGFAKVAGMTADEFKDSFEDNAAGAIVSFIEGLGRIEKAGGNVFGILEDLGMTEIRLRDAILRSAGAGDVMRNSLMLAGTAWTENNALINEAEQRYLTFASQVQITKNQLIDMGISIGTVLMPYVQELLGYVQQAIGWFSGLDERTQAVIAKVAALSAIIGVLGGGFLLMIGFLPSIISGFGALMAAGKALVAVLGLISGPVGLIVAGIAALVAGLIVAYKRVDWFRAFVDEAWIAIKDSFMQALAVVRDVVMRVIGVVAEFIGGKLAEIRAFWDENGEQISQAAQNVFGFIRNVVEIAMNAIWSVMKFIWPLVELLIKGTWDAIKRLISGALDMIMGFVKIFASLFTGDWRGLWEGVKQVLEGAWTGLIGWLELFGIGRILKLVRAFGGTIGRVFKGIWDGMTSRAKGAWDGMLSLIKGSNNAIIGMINKFIGALNKIKIKVPSVNIPLVGEVGGFSIGLPKIPTIPALEVGTNYVADDGLAYLHKGEAVVPKRYNPAAGGAGEGGPSIVINAQYVDRAALERFAAEINKINGRMIGGKR